MKKLNYILGIIAISGLLSCEKEYLFNTNQSNNSESDLVGEPLTGGQPTKIGTDDYVKYMLPEEIEKIVIKNGNGHFHVSNDRENSISLAGFWVGESNCNSAQIVGNTLIIDNSFTDTYISLARLNSVEVLAGNCTVELDKKFATGKMHVEIEGNSKIQFKEEGEEINLVEAFDFTPNVIIHGIGTFNAYGVKMQKINVLIENNGRVYAHVNELLTVKVLSNGSMFYKGNPTINSELNFNSDLIDEN